MPEAIVRLSADAFTKRLESGLMTVRPAKTASIYSKEEGKSPLLMEKAKDVFGEDFLGTKAIKQMEQKCKAKGINVVFESPTVPFPYTQEYLTTAKEEATTGRERFFSTRPSWMIHNGVKKKVTILNLRELFKTEKTTTKDGKTTITTAYDNNPFGDGAVFYSSTWFDNDEDFANKQLQAGFAMPTKEAVPGSTKKTYDQQVGLLQTGERRRSAVETVWDSLAYYSHTGNKVPSTVADWTESLTSGGNRVGVWFNADGMRVYYWGPTESLPYIGVCASR